MSVKPAQSTVERDAFALVASPYDVAQNSEKTAKLVSRGRPFLPGQSGNPGGRPKDVGVVRDLARVHTADAIETLVHVMRHGEKESARVAAAQAILDRGWGKAVQALDMAQSDEAPLKIIVEYADDYRR